MALARLLSQSLTHHTKSSPIPLSPTIVSHRHRSSKTSRPQFIEIDLDAPSSPRSSSSSNSEGSQSAEKINGGIKKLEEVIQNIIVRRAAPDWLPFRPGSSYWVPPPNLRTHPSGVVEVIGKLSTAARMLHGVNGQSQNKILALGGSSEFLSQDEALSLSSSRGWPSASYFIEGSAPTFPVPVEVEVVELKIVDNSKDVSTDEDEEG